MIIDRTENLMKYQSMLPNLKAGLAALNALTDKKAGRYEFEGGFFMIQQGSTSPVDSGDYEAHRKYIDVQIILSGSEIVVWEDISRLTQSVPYSEEKEREMFKGPVAHTFRIEEGMSWVAFPQDAHKACKHLESQNDYLKVVMKLPVK